MKSNCKLLILTLALALIQMIVPDTVRSAHSAERGLGKASLILQWMPQAQFAGYFVAQEKGFYKQHGVDLTIIPGGPDKVVSDYLDSRQAEFGTMFLSTALERRDAGMPLVNIGQIVQHSALMLIAKAGTGIETVEDLDGKKVSLWANEFQIQPRILFAQKGMEVEIVPLASSMDLFLRGAVSATSAMWYNEYHTILSSGLREDELRPFFFRDTPYDFPEDGIYCLESTLKTSPKAALAVINATLAGWRYAFAHEDETLDIVARYMTEAKLPMNRVHQRWMLRRMREIIIPGEKIFEAGILKRQVFDKVVGLLLEGGVIRNPVDYGKFYRGPSK